MNYLQQNDMPVKPSFLNNSCKKYEIEGLYHPKYNKGLNQDNTKVNSPLKGFFNHYLNRVDISKSTSDMFTNKRDFFDRINTSTINDPEDKRQTYVQ